MRFSSTSDQYGDVIIKCPYYSSLGACVLNISEDGLATYDGNGPAVSFLREQIMWPLATEAAQAPVHDFVSFLHVGADAAPPAGGLTAGVDRGGVSVSSGGVRDGVGADRLLDFMAYHLRSEDKLQYYGEIAGDSGLETYTQPPIVRLAAGTSDLNARYAAHAVQLINSALPYEKRITLSSTTLPADTELDAVPEGVILLKFPSLTDYPWKSGVLGGAILDSTSSHNADTNRDEAQNANKALVLVNEELMRLAARYDPTLPGELFAERWEAVLVSSRSVKNSDTLIKRYGDQMFVSTVVHELMHALGLYHIDEEKFPESIMRTSGKGQIDVYTPYLEGGTIFLTSGNFSGLERVDSSESDTTAPTAPDPSRGNLSTLSAGVHGHILAPIDRAALLAAYDRFDPGAQPEDLTAENLGAWTDTSFHLRGVVDLTVGDASFGVASSNGLAQPWARGPAPWTNLADNEFLSGSATWNGALLGVGSSSETVAGDAGLTVDLTSLTGRIDFTGLEKWGAGEAPGAAGSGATWGDGDLGYNVRVRGNTFTQTGGDDGHVTGAFFGVRHEAMGGVLERADLSAGFGGKR